ncbi:prolyl oligopeptidase family serine peptidase [Salinisphaera sp. SPP-AMP-43]|uniref:prolyl oligopeptidase family serine peptidase n=1 Tax=Salinisphaera sp. SPP-AMP-43 TaxID=3121288 RepID=UPI003C6DCB04
MIHPRTRRWVAPLLGLGMAGSALAGPTADYPTPHRDDTVDTYFGTQVSAPYQWMEQLDAPKLKSWVTAENALTAQRIGAFDGHSWVHQRLTALEDVPSQSVPYVAGDQLFYSSNTGLQDQSVLKVRPIDGKATEARTLLDPNTLSEDGQIALLSYKPSDDGQHVVYGLSQGGSDWQTLHVLDTASGKPTDDVIRWVKFSGLSWTHDGRGFFYSRYPKPDSGDAIADKVSVQSLYYHKLGTPQSADTLIFQRPKLADWVVGGTVSDDGRYLYISLNKGTLSNNELYIADLGDPDHPDVAAKPKPLFTANDAEYQPIGHDGETLYLLTNRDAPKGKIVSFKLDQPDNWQSIVPEGDSVIQGATLAGGRILVNRLVDVKSQVALYDSAGHKQAMLPTPGIGSVGSINAKTSRDTIYYAFTSFLSPGSVLRYNVDTGKGDTVFQPKVPFDSTKYVTDQVFYRSKDGTKIPMFIVHAKGLNKDVSHPTLLYAYGGFDISITPHFSKSVATWLDMGGIYAVANIRGGGEYGQAWHHAGMQGNKQNVFDDFAAAAHYLIDHRYTRTPHLGIEGYSNGGLLVGASITQHPELFGAAYAGAGVQDMLRYQKFSGGALWAPEYGTSDDKQAFSWLVKYSPLANVKNGSCYPPTLLTTADHDDRVVPSHTYKFAATLQHAQSQAKDCTHPILLRVDTQTSHNYMPTDKRIDRAADVLSFMAMHLGASAPGPAPVD